MSAISNPQMQKEVAKLMQYMKDFFLNLFKKDNGQNNIGMTEGQLRKLSDDLKHVVKGQEDRAKEFAKKGMFAEAAYLQIRSKTMESLRETLDPTPENLKKLQEIPTNVSPQEMNKKFDEMTKKFFDDISSDNDKLMNFGNDPILREYRKQLQSVEASHFKFDEFAKLDRDIVESRFAYGSDRDKMVHTALAVGSQTMEQSVTEALNSQKSAALKNNKESVIKDPNNGQVITNDKNDPSRKNENKHGIGAPEIDTTPKLH